MTQAPDGTMSAWAVREPGPIETGPLTYERRPIPHPGRDELQIRVRACGVCRTDLHVSEGDLPVHREHVIPGHEVVGVITQVGADVTGYDIGALVGVAWLRHTCGHCRYCLSGRENLCPESRYTGWDSDGGYAEYTTVPATFAYPLPDAFRDPGMAVLLCAGIIGYRALKRAALPDGGRLGLYGFGGSAHLCAQLAAVQNARVHVMTRGSAAQSLALSLGAASVNGAYDSPPELLDSAILFAPVGDLVPVAMQALDRGGVLSIAGIHLTDTPALNYQDELFYEKEIRSVTSNTRQDGREFLALAAEHRLRATTHLYPMARAQTALQDLKAGRFDGAAVLVNDTV
jgi:propanol-preferring alcohol dehydrogenase